MESCIYAGSVEHRREAHAAHRFRYRLFMLYLDWGSMDRVFEGRWLWSVERPNWASFRRADHFRGPGRWTRRSGTRRGSSSASGPPDRSAC
jgi:DUF1365 family protein